jgi:membrane-associated phospholipid phosphatase
MTTDLLEEARRHESATAGARPVPRLVALGVLALIFATVVYVQGGPQDYVSIFAWLWLLSVAWNIEARPVTHLAFVRDWSIPLALLSFYFYSREIADNLGIPVYYSYVIDFDVWLGRGDTPSAHLQALWCGSPCDPAGAANWYDRFFILVWMSHFTVGLTLAAAFWLRNRREFVLWMRRYVVVNFSALVCYLAIPTAPTWMASLEGRLPSDVYRLGAKAWVGPRPEGVGEADPASWAGNQVAAMPSLHTAVALMVALYGISRLRTPWRWLFLLYPLSMGLALVYLGEHYVADLAGGVALAVVVLTACTRWESWRERRRFERLPFAEPSRDVSSPSLTG